MKSLNYSFLVLSFAIALSGCGRAKIDRVEWPVMGTIAAVQLRGELTSDSSRFTAYAMGVFKDVSDALNAHVATSEISRLAQFADDEVLAKCGAMARPCYEAAFKLMRESGGAFNPRWKGPNTLDLGAIAKGFAVDAATQECYVDGADALIDLGGNLKSVRGRWRTGVRDPFGDGFAAVVELREGEALATSATYYRGSHIYDGRTATSATYYRGSHIYDGRTGLAVSNGVASVTVLCSSAMWADGLSTTLFVLGPEEGKKFLDDKLKLLVGDMEVSALWIMDGGRQEIYGNARFQGN